MGKTVCGHIFFSPVSVGGSVDHLRLGLAPLGVQPACIDTGSQLVVAGIECCRRLGGAGVVVVGSPSFYGRIGFLPAEQAIRLRYRVSAPTLIQAMELKPRGMRATCRDCPPVDFEYNGAFDKL